MDLLPKVFGRIRSIIKVSPVYHFWNLSCFSNLYEYFLFPWRFYTFYIKLLFSNVLSYQRYANGNSKKPWKYFSNNSGQKTPSMDFFSDYNRNESQKSNISLKIYCSGIKYILYSVDMMQKCKILVKKVLKRNSCFQEILNLGSLDYEAKPLPQDHEDLI